MRTKRTMAATALSATMLMAGTGLASSADAGQSIRTTWNAKVKVYYVYFASTDTFCVKRGRSSPKTGGVRLFTNTDKAVALETTGKVRGCVKMTGYPVARENQKVRFTLYNSLGATSRGSFRV